MTDLPQSITIPWPGHPKARPRFDSRSGRAFMPKGYAEWKKVVAQFLSLSRMKGVGGPVMLEVVFGSTEIHVRLVPVVGDYQRAKYVTADLDNLLGGVMDALQDSNVLENDSQVVAVTARIEGR